ncbi:MAG: UvrD-helicase domain-containing protein, partial [Bacteroidia bacterium]
MNPGSLIIYRASAGAGKTFTLVKEYLKIVLVNPYDYRHVLAITFTNKATEEMKSRIMGTLSEMATSSPAAIQAMPMYADIKAHLLKNEKSDPETVIKHARKTLHLILADYSSFSVSTIESFFQKIIRAFSRELNVPLGYEIDMRQKVILEEVMQSTLRDAGKKEDVTRLLSQFLQRNLEQEKGWRIEGGIRKLGNQLFKEHFQETLVSDTEDFSVRQQHLLDLEKSLHGFVAKFHNTLASMASEAIERLDASPYQLADFYQSSRGPVAWMKKVAQKIIDTPNSYVSKIVNGDAAWVSKSKLKQARFQGALAFAEDYLDDTLRSLHDYWEKEKKGYNTARIVLRHMHEFALMFDLQKRLADYRTEKGRLIISDTNLLLKQVIGDQETPFVYEKVGNRYHYFLIDEFQDTSDMQWANLYPLIVNVLAQGNHSLLVGDVKQSIFRWRNGNPELLMFQAQSNIEQSGAQVKSEFLQSNWRTAPRIVDFNNRFFPLLADAFAKEHNEVGELYLKTAYDDVAQTPKREETEGYVSVESFAKVVNKEKLNWEEAALDRTLEIIKEAEAQGFKHADIAMLVRENKHAAMLAMFLQSHGYKVASPDALVISKDAQVQFLVNVLRWLNEPSESINTASLAYAYQNIAEGEASEHEVFSLGEDAIPDAIKVHADRLRRLALLPCLERICLLFPQFEQPNAFVSALLEQALGFSGNSDSSLAGFLQFWDEEGS